MPKLAAVALITFALGVLAGRLSVTLPSPPPTTMATPPPATTEPGSLSGVVAEVLQVPPYTYLRLQSGEWAAVSEVPSLQPGRRVTVLVQTELSDFTSASLGRTFARIAFGTLDGAAQTPQPTAVSPGVAAALAAVQEQPAALLQNLDGKATATGEFRVEELYAQRAALNGRRVRVRGTVDRVNTVQGVHYVHLKDGSGTAEKKDDDLLCISQVTFDKGAQVSLEGTVAVDRNVGMGVNPVVLDDVVSR